MASWSWSSFCICSLVSWMDTQREGTPAAKQKKKRRNGAGKTRVEHEATRSLARPLYCVLLPLPSPPPLPPAVPRSAKNGPSGICQCKRVHNRNAFPSTSLPPVPSPADVLGLALLAALGVGHALEVGVLARKLVALLGVARIGRFELLHFVVELVRGRGRQGSTSR